MKFDKSDCVCITDLQTTIHACVSDIDDCNAMKLLISREKSDKPNNFCKIPAQNASEPLRKDDYCMLMVFSLQGFHLCVSPGRFPHEIRCGNTTEL